MFFMWILMACDDGEKAQLEAEVLRLESRVASMELEIEGLHRANKNLEMLEEASASATAPIEGRCRPDPNGGFLVSGDLLKAIQDAPEALIREGRWIPSPSGRANAWRAVHIRRGGLLASCGFRNGDVLLSVAGDTTPPEWRATLDKASETRSLQMELRRAHSTVLLDYRLD
jgi:hypothetical protein